MKRGVVRVAVLMVALLFVAIFVARLFSGGDETADGPAVAASEHAAPPTAETACIVSRRYLLREADRPPKSAVVRLGSGERLSPDREGRWQTEAEPEAAVVVWVESKEALVDASEPRRGGRGADDAPVIPAGVAQATYRLDGECRVRDVDVRLVVSGAGSAERPAPPQPPAGYVPSAALLAFAMPAPGPGDGTNVPWTGDFWLTAPRITIGICRIRHRATREAAEVALTRWQEAPGLAWQLERDDAVCDASSPGPKVVVGRQRIGEDDLLGREWTEYVDEPFCAEDDLACWTAVAHVVANPAGFDDLSFDLKVSTYIHELGHAFGLAHARRCGSSVMWEDDSCDEANRPVPGEDDIASLNDLLIATVAALR